jgi:hypothetical protein
MQFPSDCHVRKNDSLGGDDSQVAMMQYGGELAQNAENRTGAPPSPSRQID